MIIFKTKADLSNYLSDFSAKGKIIGFVPTMGALHKGHISLVEIAKKECDMVVCSIFVNPTQFNDLSDLDKYPRTMDADTALLQSAGCDVLFAPEINEMYTAEELLRKKNHVEDHSWMEGKTVDFGNLDKVMEGAQRPGHYNGVAQVVSKLFRIVKPRKAYFGQKDFQQYTVIKSMTKQLGMPIEIVNCPIIRTSDGLAMSSRNIRLTAPQRAEVPLIFKMLGIVNELKSSFQPKELSLLVTQAFNKNPLMQLEYFEIVDADTLLPVTDLKTATSAVACIAVKLSTVRLIDNMVLV
jgi:pantoate--beta-alanine ligase